MYGMYRKKAVFVAACVGMSFFGITMITLGSVLPHISETFGLNQLEKSALVVFLPIGILLGSLLFGPIVDRWGYKSLLMVSALFVALGLEGLALIQNLALLRFAILSIGLGGGVINGLSTALVSDITTDTDRKAKLSFLGIFYGIGALGVPVLFAFLSKYYAYQTILQYIGFLVLLCTVFFVSLRFPSAKQPQGFPLMAGIKLLKEPLLLMMGFLLFFLSSIEALGNNWTTTYLGEVAALTAEQALFVLTCMMVGLTAARLVLSALFRVVGEKRLFLGSMIIALTGCLLLFFSPSFLGASIAMGMMGFGLSSTVPVVFGTLGSAYPSLSGTVFSITLVIGLIGNTITNYLMGAIAQKWGIELYPLLVLISMCAMVLLFSLSAYHTNATDRGAK